MPPQPEDKLRRAADNALLILISRWCTVVLVPIILMFGTWIVTTVQQLVIDVQDIRVKQTASIELLNERISNVDRSLSQRTGTIEKRVDRLEMIEDRRVYVQPKQ